MVRYLAEPLSEPLEPNLSTPETSKLLDAEHTSL
jgi:hypothetical protein